jgi:hypothetical protein
MKRMLEATLGCQCVTADQCGKIIRAQAAAHKASTQRPDGRSELMASMPLQGERESFIPLSIRESAVTPGARSKRRRSRSSRHSRA